MSMTGPRASRALLACAGLLAFLLPVAVAAGSRMPDPRRMDAITRKLEAVQALAVDDYLKGDAAAALARVRGIVDERNWVDLLALANMTWVSNPAESLQWHQQAYAMSGHSDDVLLELAYHYTRRDECAQAVEAWAALDRAGKVGGYMPMLAGYCHLKLGQDAEAFRMFDRAQVGGHDGRFEQVLGELWGPKPSVMRFADNLSALKASGDGAAFDQAILLAFGMEGHERGLALSSLADAAAPHARALHGAAADLDCLRPVFSLELTDTSARDYLDPPADADYFETEAKYEKARAALKDAWTKQLDACGLVTAGHALPSSSSLARALVALVDSEKIATPEDLLARHGKALDARARSQEGDLQALELLAALQARTTSPDLAGSDELGWTRYRRASFAASRVIGLLLKDKAPTPEALATLDRAHQDFPDDANLLQFWLQYGKPTPEQARAGWRALALMQFHQPTGRSLFGDGPSASTLYLALGQYRKAAGL